MTLEAHRKAKIDAALTASKAELAAFIAEAKAAGTNAVLVLRFSEEEAERKLVIKEFDLALKTFRVGAIEYEGDHGEPGRHHQAPVPGGQQLIQLKDGRKFQVHIPRTPVPSTGGPSWLVIHWPPR